MSSPVSQPPQSTNPAELRWEVKGSAVSLLVYIATCVGLLTGGKGFGELSMLLNPIAGGFAIGLAISGCRRGSDESRKASRLWLLLSLVTAVLWMLVIIASTSWIENVREMLGIHP